MGKSAPSSTTTNTTVNKLPDFIEQGGKQNYEYAQGIADNLADPYSGNLVADFNDTQRQSWDMAKQGATMAMPAIGQAGQTLGQEQAYKPQDVQAQSWLNLNDDQRQAYMNPYTQNVVNTSLDAMNDARMKALSQTGDQAISSGAFGGSRHGVMEGATNAQSAKDQGALAAQLYSQAYQNAQNTFNTDADRDLTGQRANQTTDLQASQARTQAAQAATQNAMYGQNSWMQGAAATQAVGDQEQAMQQAKLNQAAMQYDAQRNLPLEKLGIRTSALALTPYGTTSTSTSTQQGGSGGGMGSAIGGIGSLMGALLPMLPFSDERVKENIKPTGVVDPKTGVDIHEYNYIGDKTKRVGPMMQDLEQAGFPSIEIGGVKAGRPEDVVTPTVKKVAAEKGAHVAKTFLGESNGPGLLSGAPINLTNKPSKKKGKK